MPQEITHRLDLVHEGRICCERDRDLLCKFERGVVATLAGETGTLPPANVHHINIISTLAGESRTIFHKRGLPDARRPFRWARLPCRLGARLPRYRHQHRSHPVTNRDRPGVLGFDCLHRPLRLAANSREQLTVVVRLHNASDRRERCQVHLFASQHAICFRVSTHQARRLDAPPRRRGRVAKPFHAKRKERPKARGEVELPSLDLIEIEKHARGGAMLRSCLFVDTSKNAIIRKARNFSMRHLGSPLRRSGQPYT
jgi:hypothetical protein